MSVERHMGRPSRHRVRFQPTPFARSLLQAMRGNRPPMLERWLDGVFPPVCEQAEARSVQIRLHDSVLALNSSMVFAFNLFLPFKEHPLELGPPFEDVSWDRVELEWTPPGRLLGEIDGDHPRADEHATAIDAVLHGRRRDSRTVMVLVEVKLTEGGFSQCNGAESHNNATKDLCDDADEMLARPERCYLTHPLHQAHPRRYWDIFRTAHGSLAATFPGVPYGACPFRGHGQQIMRQHALALALEQTGIADETWLLLVHHDGNPDVPLHFDAYRAWLADASRLLRLPATALLRAGPPAWAAWMQARYLLRCP